MHPVAKRIAVHAGLTAVLLAVMGVVLAQMAGAVLAPNSSVRPGSAQLNPPDNSLSWRIPLAMAFWGAVFVAAIELILFAIRGNPKPPRPPEPQPDTEKLLNELLAQTEAKAAGPQGQEAGGGGQQTASE